MYIMLGADFLKFSHCCFFVSFPIFTELDSKIKHILDDAVLGWLILFSHTETVSYTSLRKWAQGSRVTTKFTNIFRDYFICTEAVKSYDIPTAR